MFNSFALINWYNRPMKPDITRQRWTLMKKSRNKTKNIHEINIDNHIKKTLILAIFIKGSYMILKTQYLVYWYRYIIGISYFFYHFCQVKISIFKWEKKRQIATNIHHIFLYLHRKRFLFERSQKFLYKMFGLSRFHFV